MNQVKGFLATILVGAISGALLGFFTPSPTGCLDVCVGGPELYAVVFGGLGAIAGLLVAAALAGLNALGWCKTYSKLEFAGGALLGVTYLILALAAHDRADLAAYTAGHVVVGTVMGAVYGLVAKAVSTSPK